MDKLRKKIIERIVCTIKLLLLLFCMIIILKKYFKFSNNACESIYLNFYNSIILSVFMISIYCMWNVFKRKKLSVENCKKYSYVENIVFILVISMIVIYTGANKSNYKFMFIFVIIISIIELDCRYSFFVCLLSSLILFSIDLVWNLECNINENLENDLVLSILFLIISWILYYYKKMEKIYIKKLSYLANVDGLTGVYNHRYFYEKLDEILKDTNTEFQSVSLIFMDIDFFKNYNDMYGHQRGDDVLRNIGYLLKHNFRIEDVVSRYGGEEFAIILPNTCEKVGVTMAENIRYKIQEFKFKGEENQPNGRVTVSIGVSVFPSKATNARELVKTADDALYKAKFLNKNRVESYYSIIEEMKRDIKTEEINNIIELRKSINNINSKDNHMCGHIERMLVYCEFIGNELNLTEKDKKILRYGIYFHDIGKINIPESIFNIETKLDKNQLNIIRSHTIEGAKIVKKIQALNKIIPLVLYHHEKYDGSGYPYKLKGTEIPYLVRILTVINKFDSLTSNKSYRRKIAFISAIRKLNENKNTWFDPDIVDSFIKSLGYNKNNT